MAIFRPLATFVALIAFLAIRLVWPPSPLTVSVEPSAEQTIVLVGGTRAPLHFSVDRKGHTGPIKVSAKDTSTFTIDPVFLDEKAERGTLWIVPKDVRPDSATRLESTLYVFAEAWGPSRRTEDKPIKIKVIPPKELFTIHPEFESVPAGGTVNFTLLGHQAEKSAPITSGSIRLRLRSTDVANLFEKDAANESVVVRGADSTPLALKVSDLAEFRSHTVTFDANGLWYGSGNSFILETKINVVPPFDLVPEEKGAIEVKDGATEVTLKFTVDAKIEVQNALVILEYPNGKIEKHKFDAPRGKNPVEFPLKQISTIMPKNKDEALVPVKLYAQLSDKAPQFAHKTVTFNFKKGK